LFFILSNTFQNLLEIARFTAYPSSRFWVLTQLFIFPNWVLWIFCWGFKFRVAGFESYFLSSPSGFNSQVFALIGVFFYLSELLGCFEVFQGLKAENDD